MEIHVVWIVRLIYTLYDITAQKDAEAQVIANEARYRALADATTEGIFISQDGVCIDANRAASKLTGYSHEALLGMFGTDVIAPESRQRVRENMLSGVESPYEAVGLRKDGARFPCELEGRMFERDGVKLQATAMRDLTQRRQLEQAARQSEKLRAIGTLTGGIAHDFNNILAIINGEVELLCLDEGLDEVVREALDLIAEAGQRGARLTKHLLAFSRGQEAARPEVMDLNAHIERTFRLLRRLLPEDIEVICELTPGISHIYADPDQIEQILMNLVINARDALLEQGEARHPQRIAIETGEARLEGVRVTPCAPGTGTFLHLAVCDNGVGLAPEIATRIFEPFFSGKSIHKGTGLGLSTVYGIITKAGGFIDVTTTPGLGLCVEILWPTSRREIIEAASKPKIYLNARPGERVLLAEDDLELRRVAQDALRMHGYKVIAPETSRLALEQIRAGLGYDILVSDVVMPEVSGWALATESQARAPDRAILLMSGYTFEREEDARAARFGAILSKPYRIVDLLQIIRARLDARSFGQGVLTALDQAGADAQGDDGDDQQAEG
ncbi:PAS domain S-box protein [Myxococcota bacterium]|nr:PAS domain S-box protein [Myxococcota bacterium]